MISKKLEQLKTFLRKEGGGDGGGDGGGFAGTAFTVDSSGFVPTYSGGDDKKPKKKTKKDTPESFAEELMKFAIDKSMELKKNMSLGIGHKDMRNTDLGQSTRSGDNRKYTRTADVGGNNQYKVLNPPEIPFEHDAVLNWEDIFQKAETDDLQITAKVLIRDESNKVLILKDRFSDWWDLPGGHIHTEETPEEGALREVEEETGIKLNEVDLVIGQEVDTDLGHKLGLFLVAYVPLDSPKPLLSDEHTDYAWIGMDETYYYNLGVWEPIIRYVFRFISEGTHENLGQLYTETQSDALNRLDKAMVIHTDESGDKTALASDGIYLVKSDGKVFKQEPWPASEETGDLLNIEEDDFLDKKWILDKWKDQPIPMQFYRPVNKEHQNIISRPFKILLGTPDKYVVAEPPAPNSGEVLDGLEQVQMDFRYLSDRGKDRLEEVVNKSDTTLLRPFMEYARDHGLRIDLYESLLEDLLEDVNTIVMDKKYKINYPRPWQYEMDEPYFIYDVVNAIRPSIDTPSYPSGHSTQALVIAEILGNMYPNHLENFREIADDIGINRVKAGWHFLMDHTAGKKLALEIVDTLPDSMELEKDRVYLKPGQATPEGVQVETGPSGGRFYDAEVDPSLEELEGSDRGKPLNETTMEEREAERSKPAAEGRESGMTGGFQWEKRNRSVEKILGDIGMSEDEYKQKLSLFEEDPETQEQLGDPFDAFKTPEDLQFLGSWTASSIGDSAISMQYAASDFFSSSSERLDKVSKHFTSSYPDENVEDFTQPESIDPARQYVEETYANTQRSFEERGITELTLYRGVGTDGQVGVKPGERIATKDLPLSSWTADPEQAPFFGDVVVSRTFDVRDILTGCTDKLPSDEFEFIVHTPDVGFEAKVEHVSSLY
jgi:8-oxo-dGTP pyrophosphatase MutT (NUDIX family)